MTTSFHRKTNSALKISWLHFFSPLYSNFGNKLTFVGHYEVDFEIYERVLTF